MAKGSFGDTALNALGYPIGFANLLMSARGGNLYNQLIARNQALQDPAQRQAMIGNPFPSGMMFVHGGQPPSPLTPEFSLEGVEPGSFFPSLPQISPEETRERRARYQVPYSPEEVVARVSELRRRITQEEEGGGFPKGTFTTYGQSPGGNLYLSTGLPYSPYAPEGSFLDTRGAVKDIPGWQEDQNLQRARAVREEARRRSGGGGASPSGQPPPIPGGGRQVQYFGVMPDGRIIVPDDQFEAPPPPAAGEVPQRVLPSETGTAPVTPPPSPLGAPQPTVPQPAAPPPTAPPVSPPATIPREPGYIPLDLSNPSAPLPSIEESQAQQSLPPTAAYPSAPPVSPVGGFPPTGIPSPPSIAPPAVTVPPITPGRSGFGKDYEVLEKSTIQGTTTRALPTKEQGFTDTMKYVMQQWNLDPTDMQQLRQIKLIAEEEDLRYAKKLEKIKAENRPLSETQIGSLALLEMAADSANRLAQIDPAIINDFIGIPNNSLQKARRFTSPYGIGMDEGTLFWFNTFDNNLQGLKPFGFALGGKALTGTEFAILRSLGPTGNEQSIQEFSQKLNFFREAVGAIANTYRNEMADKISPEGWKKLLRIESGKPINPLPGGGTSR